MRHWLVPLAALLLAGCPAAAGRRPTGPPPVYEKPVLPAWEAAAPAANPLDSLAQGGWVDETGDEDAGDAAADAPADAAPEAAVASDAGVSDAAAQADSGASRPASRGARPAH